ncbi:MAG: REP-associated tyrosine transposase [Bacillota bacterium]
MVRQARKVSPTDYYHIMMRGNNREKIFTKEEQKKYILQLIKKFEEEDLIEIAAYCLMDNHVHFVVKGELTNLSSALKKINIKYAMKFNKEANRVGHVFQDRYKSEIITDEKYLLNVIRYVHNNPIKAKMVNGVGEYKWSSYNEYLSNISMIVSQQQKEFIMELFACKKDLFIEFHEEIDLGEYLDTKEEIVFNRNEIAQSIIGDFCVFKGITDIRQLTNKPEYLEELIRKLLDGTKLSHRQIARILEISNSIVHKASVEK